MIYSHVVVTYLFRYGMSINNDSVMRSVYYKYIHPKEVFIAEGTLVPDLIRKKVNVFPCTFYLAKNNPHMLHSLDLLYRIQHRPAETRNQPQRLFRVNRMIPRPTSSSLYTPMVRR